MLSQIDLTPEWLATIQCTNDYLHTILAIKDELNLFGKGLTYEQAMEQWWQQTPEATKLGFGLYWMSQEPLSNLQKYEQSLASMKRYFSDLIPTLAPKLALPAPKLIEIKTHLPWWGYVLLGVGVALAFSLIFCIFLVRKKSKTHSQEKGSDRIGDSHRFF